MSKSSNHLAGQKSPYLQQHAHNPVDWYPWSDEAFRIAKEKDIPVFLSIGYSTCHWCHVMERESFEDPRVGEAMNHTFVSIKVDREERPDVDHFYMEVSQRINGSGGWPLNVILTPDRKPIFAMTYLPKTSRNGQMGIVELCDSVGTLWKEKRTELQEQAENISRSMSLNEIASGPEPDPDSIMDTAFQQFRKTYDSEFGGFGTRPKFPTPHNISFLLRYHLRTGNKEALVMALHTLRAMRNGGIFDHVGFGFHRYSTDSAWIVPHFEKMLYDQGLLLRAYSEAFMATGDMFFKRIADEIVLFLESEMASPEGGLYSAMDADSEGVEGKYYLWTFQDLQTILDKDLQMFSEIFNVTRQGNFHDESTGRPTGMNVLYLSANIEEIAGERGITVGDLLGFVDRCRKKLINARSGRVKPSTDRKILTDVNSIALSGLAIAYKATGNATALDLAKKILHFIESNLAHGDQVFHSWIDGTVGKYGFLADYAYLVGAYIDLFDSTGENRHLERAVKLANVMTEKFVSESGGFFFTPPKSYEVPVPVMDQGDSAVPSGNSMALFDLARISAISFDPEISDIIGKALRQWSESLTRSPMYFSALLCALDIIRGPVYALEIRASNEKDAREIMALSNGRLYSQLFVKSSLVLKDLDHTSVIACGQNSCLPEMKGIGAFRKWISTSPGLRK